MLTSFEPIIMPEVGRKNVSWYATIGDNLNDKWYEWHPFIELNCAKIWQATGNFQEFVRLLNESVLHEYLHLFVRIEATKPPGGTGSIPLEWKGKREEEGVWKLTYLLLDIRDLSIDIHNLLHFKGKVKSRNEVS